MKKFLAVLTCASALSGAVIASPAPDSNPVVASTTTVTAPIWTTAYYAGWRYDTLPYNKVSFGGITHIAHAFVMPKPDGTLDDATFQITPTRSTGLIQAAHSNNVKVLISIGGAGTAPAFRTAINDTNRAKFIGNIVYLASFRGYDGVDIDFEPMLDSDEAAYAKFIVELRAKIDSNTALFGWPRLLLTCAVGSDRSRLFVSLKDKFDQVNIMTYDMSGVWPGWETWHNAPLLHTGLKINDGPRDFPSAQKTVADWRAAGMTPSKLGIGAAFYAKAWRRATAPEQPITGVTIANLDYKQVMSTYYTSSRYRWDSRAGAAYLSVDQTGTDNDYFISYEDTRALRDKVLWTRQQALGGLIIWELASGYVPTAPVGQQHPLLEAVRAASVEAIP